MPTKKVTAQTPQNTDVLGINNILKGKIDNIPTGQQLTYFPVKDATATASAATNHGPLNVLDSSPDTYWQPSEQVAGAHIELKTYGDYECYGVDIKFKESENMKFNLKVDVLDKVNNRWLTMATAESSLLDDNKYERFHAAQHFKTDTYRIIINSVFDTKTGHVYTQPKITQIRLFGLVPDADVAKYKVKTDQECPEGYGKDAESGQCVKSIPSQIIKPVTVDAKSAIDMGAQTPTGNDPQNLLSVDPNDKLTLKGVGSTIEYGLSKNDKIHGVYIHKLNNPPRQYTLLTAFYNGQDKQPFYSFVVDIPDSQDKYVHILNEPLRADRFVLSVVDNTEPAQWFSLFGLYLIGEQNVAEPPKPTEPEDKGRVKDWGSKDKDPNNWKVVSMSNPKTKFKVVDKDGVNVADSFNTQKGAQKFIDDAIANYKPTEPPTKPEPPTNPPTQPPIDPNAKVDAQGVVMIYAPKAGGQVVTFKETNQKQSEHNTGKRSSLYSNKPYSANSGELTEYFKMNLSDNGEQNAPKILSGGHTGSGDNDETRQGQCYAVGINQNGSLHLAKEYPHHPTTPKAYDKIQYLDPNWKNLGSIKDKFVGMKIIYFPVEKAGKKGMHMEWWFDKKALETGKKENDWKQMAFAEDFGDWGNQFGPPHLENMGVKYKGKILGHYIRIDTPTKPVEFFDVGQHELEIPPRKLIGGGTGSGTPDGKTLPPASTSPTLTGKTLETPKTNTLPKQKK